MFCITRFKTTITVAALCVFLIPNIVLAADSTPKKKASSTPSVAAEVNGKTIPYSDYERQLDMFKKQVSRGQMLNLPPEKEKELQNQVIEKMVADELLFQEATKQGIKVADKDIDAELTKIKSRFKDESEFHKRLKGVGLSEATLKTQIVKRKSVNLLIEKNIIPNVKVDDKEAKKYYDTNKAKFSQPEQLRASHILMKVEKGDSEEKKKTAKKNLQDIKKRLLAGEDFSKLAKEHSQGPSNVKGGDLGYFTKGRMVKAFDDVAFKLALNEVSDIVETQFGYHLIKVVERKAAGTQPFDSVKEKLKSFLFNEQVQKKIVPYIKELRDKAKVKVNVK